MAAQDDADNQSEDILSDDIFSDDDDVISKYPDDVSQLVYVKACSLFKLTPSSYCFRHLTTVEVPLQNQAIGAAGAKALATALVPNVTVKRLNLTRTGIGTEGLRYILEMLEENFTIDDLNVSGNELGSAGMRLLCEAFKVNHFVRRLDISENDFHDEDSAYIEEIIEENLVLQELVVSGNTLADIAGINIGRALVTNTTLTSLDLSWNHLRQRGAMDICYGIQENSGLLSLNLSWNGFGLEGCHEMGKALKINRTLAELDLSANRINLDAFRLILRGLMKNTSIHTLKVGVNPITTDGASAILKAVADDSCRSLQHLDLSEICVDNDFVVLLSEIQERRPLSVKYGITLRHDEIRKGHVPVVLDTDDPVTILFEFMKTKNLRLIDLLRNLDKDNNDMLSREELGRGLEEIDIPLSRRSLDILMQRLDINKDGQVDFGELVIKYKEHLRRLAKLKREADTDLQRYKSFDRLQQLRQAVRLRLAMSAPSACTQT